MADHVISYSGRQEGARWKGFTLIELSIVLVIIGLIVGGVLVGQDLIRAAEVRATLSQIEKYNTAVNTFRGKYGALPGDMNPTTATSFGFTPRGNCGGASPCLGEGDGNGIIEGVTGGGANKNNGLVICTGENGLFWIDLSTANGLNTNMIDGSFSSAKVDLQLPGTPTTPATISSVIGTCLPPAKLGRGNFVYVYSSGSTNYFGISVPTDLINSGRVLSSVGLTVLQAYGIDTKMDDGLPLSGNVQVQYLNGPVTPATASGNAPAGATDCYDSTTMQGAYAVSVAASAVNCALSFRFQ